MRVDLHNHTIFCNHATGTMEEYIKKAIDLKIDIFGFSCHAPMDFEKEYRMSMEQNKIYKKNIIYLKEKYKNKIKILFAYEVDYMSNSNLMEDAILQENRDYLIGSVHFLDKWGFDNPEFIKFYNHKDINTIWEKYFDTVNQMVNTGLFNIVGHLDLIKVFKFMPTKSIVEIAKQTMLNIKKSEMAIEINSSGLRKPIQEQYPSDELLKLAFELEIPITFSSDAHSLDQIGLGYEKTINIAKKIGYKECVIFENKIKKFVSI